jgi:NhaP-type Na+/H+ or K+/H+ antiporter
MSAEADEGLNTVFFIFLTLTIGALCRQLLKGSRLPYTVVLLLVGIGVGVIARTNHSVESFTAFADLDPHLVLFVFLPLLLFESAFNIHIHVAVNQVQQILLLAVPGVIFGTITMGLMIYYILPNEYNWIESALLGSVLAATDPVAVVALLRELGASVSLATLIEGESLFNDGTAIVFFNILEPAAVAGSFDKSVGQVIVTFLYVALGGLLVGFLSGTLSVYWLSSVYNDALVEITITLGSTYISFYLAEELKMSGVIAVVALGLVVSRGRTRISPEVEKFLHRFYEMAAYLANTLVFTFCGMVVAAIDFDATDIFYLFVIYILMHVARAAMTLVFYPLLNYKAKYPVTWKEAFIMVYGGLRGTAGLALGLVIRNSFHSEKGDMLLFYIAGIVVLTLVINGTTIQIFLDAFKMTSLSHDQKSTLKLTLNSLKETADSQIDVMKVDKFLADADWPVVRNFIELKSAGLDEINERSASSSESNNIVVAQRMLREKFLAAEKAKYLSMYEEGTLGQNAVNFLVEAVDHAHDDGLRMVTSHDLQKALQPSKTLVYKLAQIPLLGRFFRGKLFAKCFFAYHIGLGYISAQESVRALLKIRSPKEQENLDKKAGRKSVKAAIGASGFSFAAVVASEVHKNSSSSCELVLRSLLLLRETQPEIAASVKTSFAIRRILDNQLHQLHSMRHNGVIDEVEEERLRESVEMKKRRLHFAPPFVGTPSLPGLLDELSWLTGTRDNLRKNVVDDMLKLAQLRKLKMGEFLVRMGDSSNSDIYMITRGLARVEREGISMDIGGIGSMYGELGFLTGNPRFADVVAETDMEVAVFSTQGMKDMFEANPWAKTKMWAHSSRRLAETLLKMEPEYESIEVVKLRLWLKDSQFHEAPSEKADWTRSVDHVAVLVHGEAKVSPSQRGGNGADESAKGAWSGPLKAPKVIEGPVIVSNVSSAKLLIIDGGAPKIDQNLKRLSTIHGQDRLGNVAEFVKFQTATKGSDTDAKEI